MDIAGYKAIKWSVATRTFIEERESECVTKRFDGTDADGAGVRRLTKGCVYIWPELLSKIKLHPRLNKNHLLGLCASQTAKLSKRHHPPLPKSLPLHFRSRRPPAPSGHSPKMPLFPASRMVLTRQALLPVPRSTLLLRFKGTTSSPPPLESPTHSVATATPAANSVAAFSETESEAPSDFATRYDMAQYLFLSVKPL